MGGQAFLVFEAGGAAGAIRAARCSALIDELAERGWRCQLASTPQSGPSETSLARWTVTSTSPTELPNLVLNSGPLDLLLIDHPGLDTEALQACQGAARRLMRVDDQDDPPLEGGFRLTVIVDDRKRPGPKREVARGLPIGLRHRLDTPLGARRVVNEIEAALSDDDEPVRLRPAEFSDGELMFAWQQAPGVRRFSHNPRPPQRDEHFAWLERRLADKDAGPFEIILAGAEPAGVLRYDFEPENGAYRVSILLAPQAQGRGIALSALKLGGALMRGKAVKAEVLTANTASHRLFQRAGYVQVDQNEYRKPARIPEPTSASG